MSQTDHSNPLPTLSFEFFPPRESGSVARLLDGTVTKLAAFDPDYCSVTYGAGGSTRQGTRDLVGPYWQRKSTPSRIFQLAAAQMQPCLSLSSTTEISA